MRDPEVFKRFEDLHDVLAYCSEVQKHGRIHVFKTGERICINQERGALYSQLAHANNEIPSHEVRFYKIPPNINAKVLLTLEKVKLLE